MCMHMYIYMIHRYTHADVVYTYMYIYIYMYTYTYNTYTHIYIYVCVYMYIYMYTDNYIHNLHTFAYTHTHTLLFNLARLLVVTGRPCDETSNGVAIWNRCGSKTMRDLNCTNIVIVLLYLLSCSHIFVSLQLNSQCPSRLNWPVGP